MSSSQIYHLPDVAVVKIKFTQKKNIKYIFGLDFFNV